jgi:hypothetical protein
MRIEAMVTHETNSDSSPAIGGLQVLLQWLRRVFPGRSLDLESAVELELSYQTPRHVRPAKITQITCLDGTAWLTIDGQLSDVLLTPGQVYFLCPNQRGLLAGMPTARVRVMSARKEAMARRPGIREGAVENAAGPAIVIDRITQRVILN